MLETILTAISHRLDEIYPEIPIASERTSQGFSEPSFFIQLIDTSQIRNLGDSIQGVVLLNVQYFPAEGQEKNKEMDNMSMALFSALRLIEFDGYKFIVQNAKATKVDDVLNFTFSISFMAEYKSVPLDNMEEAKIESSLNE